MTNTKMLAIILTAFTVFLLLQPRYCADDGWLKVCPEIYYLWSQK